jgi:cell wall-associated NlpC family hydrolase
MKKALFLLVFLAGNFVGFGQKDSLRSELEIDSIVVDLNPRELIDSVLNYAETFIGCRYGYGSCGPNTFDCSGFVRHVYGKFGVDLPHGSGTQGDICKTIKLKKVKPGDLLFFSGRKVSGNKIGHVAIVKEVDGDQIKMIHATVQAGVIIEELEKSEYFKKRFIKAGRLSLN